MLKTVLKFAGIVIGVGFLMILAASFIPWLQNSFFGFSAYIVPWIVAILCVNGKATTWNKFKEKQPNVEPNVEIDPTEPKFAGENKNDDHPKKEGNTMFCINCGKELASGTKFCPECGARLDGNVNRNENVPPQYQQPVINVVNNNTNVNRFGYSHKSKWVAFFLCLFLGEFGIHRFYVGKIGTGLIWMFTLGFFGFGWIIDLIFILFGWFRDRAGQKLI